MRWVLQTSKKYQVENSKATRIWESNTVIHYKPGLETHCFKRCDVVSTVQQKEMLHCPGIKPGIKLMCNRFTFFLEIISTIRISKNAIILIIPFILHVEIVNFLTHPFIETCCVFKIQPISFSLSETIFVQSSMKPLLKLSWSGDFALNYYTTINWSFVMSKLRKTQIHDATYSL